MFHFLTIANLNTSKGTLNLLKAGQLLLVEGAEFRIHFVGAPTAEISENQMREEIAKRNLGDLAIYHGRQYGADKESRFAEADAFVLPTLDDCFPLVLLEAMQHALPIIATPVGAIPDMVQDGKNGFIIPENDAPSLAQAMQELMAMPDKAKEMGCCGNARYQAMYTKQIFERNLTEILTNIQQ